MRQAFGIRTGRITPRFRVFGSRGEWLGWVEMPKRFQVFDIRDGRILGVQYDEFGVARGSAVAREAREFTRLATATSFVRRVSDNGPIDSRHGVRRKAEG